MHYFYSTYSPIWIVPPCPLLAKNLNISSWNVETWLFLVIEVAWFVGTVKIITATPLRNNRRLELLELGWRVISIPCNKKEQDFTTQRFFIPKIFVSFSVVFSHLRLLVRIHLLEILLTGWWVCYRRYYSQMIDLTSK